MNELNLVAVGTTIGPGRSDRGRISLKEIFGRRLHELKEIGEGGVLSRSQLYEDIILSMKDRGVKVYGDKQKKEEVELFDEHGGIASNVGCYKFVESVKQMFNNIVRGVLKMKEKEDTIPTQMILPVERREDVVVVLPMFQNPKSHH